MKLQSAQDAPPQGASTATLARLNLHLHLRLHLRQC